MEVNGTVQRLFVDTSPLAKIENNTIPKHCSAPVRGTHTRHICENSPSLRETPSVLELMDIHKDEWNDSSEILPDSIKRAVPLNLFVDSEHELLICLVAKTGVTSYTSMMIQYSEQFMSKYPNQSAFDVYGTQIYYKREKHGIVQAKHLNPVKLKNALENYYKVLTVRHPFTRLYSFYKDKVAGKDCKKKIGFPDKILKYTRNITVTEAALACQYNITFEEFFAYYKTSRHHDWNEHLQRIIYQCSPCAINYDTYLRTETASVDQEYIVNELLTKNMEHEPSIKSFKANVKTSRNEGFKQVLDAYDKLSVEDIAWMETFYGDDLRLFGYDVNFGPSGLIGDCAITQNGKECC